MKCPECSADTRLCQCAEAERDARNMTNERWAAMDNAERTRHHNKAARRKRDLYEINGPLGPRNGY